MRQLNHAQVEIALQAFDEACDNDGVKHKSLHDSYRHQFRVYLESFHSCEYYTDPIGYLVKYLIRISNNIDLNVDIDLSISDITFSYAKMPEVICRELTVRNLPHVSKFLNYLHPLIFDKEIKAEVWMEIQDSSESDAIFCLHRFAMLNKLEWGFRASLIDDSGDVEIIVDEPWILAFMAMKSED